MTEEQRIAYNSKNCSANKSLEFRAGVIVDARDRNGKDYTRLDLVFSEQITIKLFDPSKNQRDKSSMSVLLSSLFEALGEDFGDIPPCRGGFHEFLGEVVDILNRHKYTMLYAKITVNEKGYFTAGEGRCFSTQPDMEYTDGDTHFLTVDEPVKSSPKESFMPEYEDISFEEVVDVWKPGTEKEVTVYSEVTTVNEEEPVLKALYGDVISFDTDVEPIVVTKPESDPVQEFLADGIVVEQEHMDTSDIVKVFDEPSDLDDIFSKPPEKAQQGYCDPDPMIMPPAEEIKEEKPKKKAPKPKIPKGADPLRYIHGDPDEIEWGTRENKIINMDDLPQ